MDWRHGLDRSHRLDWLDWSYRMDRSYRLDWLDWSYRMDRSYRLDWLDWSHGLDRCYGSYRTGNIVRRNYGGRDVLWRFRCRYYGKFTVIYTINNYS
jgi:hypothetical protein